MKKELFVLVAFGILGANLAGATIVKPLPIVPSPILETCQVIKPDGEKLQCNCENFMGRIIATCNVGMPCAQEGEVLYTDAQGCCAGLQSVEEKGWTKAQGQTMVKCSLARNATSSDFIKAGCSNPGILHVCRKKQVCPMLAPISPNFCKDGQIVSRGKDEKGCQIPPLCVSKVCVKEKQLIDTQKQICCPGLGAFDLYTKEYGYKRATCLKVPVKK